MTRIIELKQLDVKSISAGDDPKIEAIAARITSTLSSIYGEGTHEFERPKLAAELDATAYVVSFVGGSGTSIEEIREGVDRGRNRAVALLQGEVDSLGEDVAQAGQAEMRVTAPTAERKRELPSADVFIVHGHDDAAKNQVVLVVQRAGLNPVVLHEQPNAGRTIIEKFEDHGGAAGFAMVVLTPDDVGGVDQDHLQSRARQNVSVKCFGLPAALVAAMFAR